MPTYEIFENSRGQEFIRQTNEDGTIWEYAKDSDHSFYQAYLKRDEAEAK